MSVDREPSSLRSTVLRCFLIGALALMARPLLAQTVPNGSFELGSGASIQNWTFSGSGSATLVTKGPTSVHVDTGTKAAKMLANQSGARLASGRVTVASNTRYRITARVWSLAKDQQGALHAAERAASGP